MVNKSQKTLGILPVTSNMKSSTNTSSFRIRKCVVRVKRVKLHLNNIASGKKTTPYKLRRCSVFLFDINKKNVNAPRDCDAIVFEPGHNSTVCPMKPPKVVPTSAGGVKDRPAATAGQTAGKKERQAPEVVPDTACGVKSRRIGSAQPAVTAGQTSGEHRFFHRDQPPTRSRSSVTRNIYEFLSESQIDDNILNQRKDPASDIIKKMVEEGRACAITRNKGKNRKRIIKRKVRPVGRRKQCSLKKKPETDLAEPTQYVERPLSPIYDPEPDSDDGDNYADEAINVEVPAQVHTHTSSATPQNVATATPLQTRFEGSYSPLARSLLLNQRNAENPQYSLERRRELLNLARKYYSTPINRKSTPPTPRENLTCSAIGNRQSAVSSPSGGTTPWRVPDEVPMPNTFVFGFNTSQLPSYSSDHIRRSHVYLPDEPVTDAEPIESNNESVCPVLENQSIGSAANDSNGENVPPPKATDHRLEKTITPLSLVGQENENEENFVQLPNPRRTLQQRTPLKDINILDVVVLPSWKNNMQPAKTPVKENMARNHVHFENPTQNSINISRQQQESVRTERIRTSPSGNLFGFEDFLTDDDQEQSTVPVNQNTTLHEKLQRLKGLRPTERDLPQPSKKAMRYDYDDLTAGTPKQRNIKQMLCSTMVATPPPALGINETADLFKDTDPEVTFDEKKPRRTYVRERPQRKRKRVHVFFIDSDSSESEDNEQDSQDKSSDSPRKPAQVKKRARKDVEHEKKLQTFITSFNKECEEVDKFPLVIE